MGEEDGREKIGKRRRMGVRERSRGVAGEEWKGSKLYHRRRSGGKKLFSEGWKPCFPVPYLLHVVLSTTQSGNLSNLVVNQALWEIQCLFLLATNIYE